MTFITTITLTLVVIAILSASPAATTENAPSVTTFNENYRRFNNSVYGSIQNNSDLMNDKVEEQRAAARVLVNELKVENDAHVESKLATGINDARQAVTKIASDLIPEIYNSVTSAKDWLREYVEEKMAKGTSQLNAIIVYNAGKLHDLNTTCPFGWTELPNKCIRLEPKIFRKWARANEICWDHGKGGRLVEIHDRIDHTYVREEVLNKAGFCFWFGGTKPSKSSKWIHVGGQPMTYTRWISPMSRYTDVYPDCACFGYDKEGNWLKEPCTMNYQFVCQIDKIPK